MNLEERLSNGEIRVVETGPEYVKDKNTGFTYEGEYRILSDGRRQWRQLGSGGRVSQWWGWQDV